MSTAATTVSSIALHRPWWRRWRDALTARRAESDAAGAERDLRRALSGLPAQTLRDLGVVEGPWPRAFYDEDPRWSRPTPW
jgi:hypothetical protein